MLNFSTTITKVYTAHTGSISVRVFIPQMYPHVFQHVPNIYPGLITIHKLFFGGGGVSC